MGLKGKRALVTGSGRGLGREIVLMFAGEGADVVVNSTCPETADSVAEEAKSLGSKALSIPADVSSYVEVNRMFEAIHKSFGGIDILVNNAGIMLPVPRNVCYEKTAIDFTEHDWKKVFEINVNGTFFCSQAAAKYMITQKSGYIINISSTRAVRPRALGVAYCCSKAAVNMMTRVLALEWIKYGIHVNGLAPGIMTTDMMLDRVKSGVLDLDALSKKNNPIGWCPAHAIIL
jgi:2-deoxy-D-gluconate 3-dehydrogenase